MLTSRGNLQNGVHVCTASTSPGVSMLSLNNSLIDSHELHTHTHTHTTASLNLSEHIIEQDNKSHRRRAQCFWSNL